MKCDICDYSTDGITSLTHQKKIHYTLKKPFDCTKCGNGFRNKFHLHQHYQTPAKTKWKRFNALFVKNISRKSKIIGSLVIISIKTLKGSLVNYEVKSLEKKCTLSFHIEIKHPDHNMPFPEWSCDICKEPYPHSRALKGHI
jgi:hypothetical protein